MDSRHWSWGFQTISVTGTRRIYCFWSKYLASKSRLDHRRGFWTIVGAPTTDPYRDASVIHDVYCDSKERSWEETHWVFRDACRAEGLGPWQANLLYLAVFHYGPIWTNDGTLQQDTIQVDEETAAKMAEFCQENPNLSIDKLQKLDPKIWEEH